jgi:predicted transcriptional regulator
MNDTIQNRVLESLKAGQELTSAQIKARFGAGNPGAVIQALRFSGYPIYLNKKTDTKGRVTQKYRLGTPSRAVVAAGYKAMAKGFVDA